MLLTIFRFNEFSRDLDDIMNILKHDFEKRDKYLSDIWYRKVKSILIKRGALNGITLHTLPPFLKYVTSIITLEVSLY